MNTILEVKEKVLSRSDEYEFLNNQKLGDIIVLGLGGSHAYGTSIETSDVDVRGFAFRPVRSILTDYNFEDFVDVTTDTTIYSLEKMMDLLAACNPNTIEIIGMRPQDYFIMTETGRKIIDNKDLYLSKQCIKTFGGYATSQLYCLQQKTLTALSPEDFNGHIVKVINNMSDHLQKSWGISGVHIHDKKDGLYVDIDQMHDISIDAFYGLNNEIGNVIREYNKNSVRNKKAITHRKINKHAMHLLRLYMMGIDILVSHEVSTYRVKEHDLLMDVRNGKYSGEDGLMNQGFFDLLKEYESKFEEAQKITTLPDNPDRAAIKDLLYELNKTYIMDNIK